MENRSDDSFIFYPGLGDLSTPEPGQSEGLTLKLYERPEGRKDS